MLVVYTFWQILDLEKCSESLCTPQNAFFDLGKSLPLFNQNVSFVEMVRRNVVSKCFYLLYSCIFWKRMFDHLFIYCIITLSILENGELFRYSYPKLKIKFLTANISRFYRRIGLNYCDLHFEIAVFLYISYSAPHNCLCSIDSKEIYVC